MLRVVRFECESDGDLSRIWGKKDANAPERTYANSFSYTPDGKIERLKLGNNRWEWAKFNERAQLTQIGIGVGVTDDGVWKLEYKYGELESGSVNANKNTGNIAQMVVTVSGIANPIFQNYQYDSLYRLTDADEKDGLGSNAAQNWIQQFQYDRFGNRIALAQTVQRSFGAVQTNTTRDRSGDQSHPVQPVAERRQNLAVVRKPTVRTHDQVRESRERRHVTRR